MVTEVVVCAHCGTEEDVYARGEPCARCHCALTKIETCTCHVFAFVETGSKIYIAHRYVTQNPNCAVHG